MLRLHITVVSLVLCFLLTGCMNSEPDGAYCKLVYSVLHPVEKDTIDTWSEMELQDGVLVRADSAIFWVDWNSRIFTLNKKSVEITDAQSGIVSATPSLVRIVNTNLLSAGKRSLNSQGGWKFFKWNEK